MSTSKMHAILAIDLGTTSTKGLLVQSDGTVLQTLHRFNETLFPSPGFAEQNPALVYSAVADILTHFRGHEIAGICLSAAMHSLIAVDERGTPLTGAMIWSDTRSHAQSRSLEKKLAQELYEVTGTPVHPMSPLCKLLWLREHEPDVFTTAFKFVSIKEYVLFRLTGEFIIDHSIASATGLFDLDKREWSAQALALTGLTAERFSAPVSVNTSLRISPEVLREFNLADVPLVIGASDGCLAQWGSQAMHQGDVSITVGTSGAVRIASGKRCIDPHGKIFNYILNDKAFVCGGASNNGTVLLDWYAKSMDTSAGDNPDDFVKQVMTVPAGSDGLIMLPYLLGERAPIYNPDARGAFFGISVNHGKKHFQRALVEGICFQMRWIVECLDGLFGEEENILVSGGITRSENWVQILSDVLGKTIAVGETHDASAMGAAFMGFTALGIRYDRPLQSAKIFHPNAEASRIYESAFQKFKTLYAVLEKLY